MGHVFAVQISEDGFGSFAARGDSPNRHPRSGLHVPSCKDAFASSGIGDRIYFNGAPPGEFKAHDIFY